MVYDELVKYCEKRGVRIIGKIGMDDMISEYLQIIGDVEKKIRESRSAKCFYTVRDGNVLTIYSGRCDSYGNFYRIDTAYNYKFKIQFFPSMRATMRIGINNVSSYTFNPEITLSIGLDPKKFENNVNTIIDFVIKHTSSIDKDMFLDYCKTVAAIDELC